MCDDVAGMHEHQHSYIFTYMHVYMHAYIDTTITHQLRYTYTHTYIPPILQHREAQFASPGLAASVGHTGINVTADEGV